MDEERDRSDNEHFGVGVRRRSAIDTEIRSVVDRQDDYPDGPWRHLVDEWWRLKPESGLPDYSDFEILNVPGELWPNVCVTSLEGRPRKFFVRMIGSAIEANNGFFGNNRFMVDLPLKNRRVMAREFAWTVRLDRPVYSEGPYIGAADYVKRVRRLITPYRIAEGEYAFVFMATFDPHDGLEYLMKEPVT